MFQEAPQAPQTVLEQATGPAAHDLFIGNNSQGSHTELGYVMTILPPSHIHSKHKLIYHAGNERVKRKVRALFSPGNIIRLSALLMCPSGFTDGNISLNYKGALLHRNTTDDNSVCHSQSTKTAEDIILCCPADFSDNITKQQTLSSHTHGFSEVTL